MELFLRHIVMRKTFAGLFFVTTFLLTPRVWVGETKKPEVDHISVDMLEAGDDCLWCNDIQPVDCATQKAPRPTDTILVHPDQAPPEHKAAPCIQPPTDETSKPSA